MRSLRSAISLVKRTRLVDVLRCQKCDGRMELVAFVTDPNLAAGVLEQLGMSIPARAPPS